MPENACQSWRSFFATRSTIQSIFLANTCICQAGRIVHHGSAIMETMMKLKIGYALISAAMASQVVAPLSATAQTCEAKSGAQKNPVIELYTSEGCSSCPPADRWLSGFAKETQSNAVVMAFHVSYWDYIGWVDRFAMPVFNQRQRDIARQNGSQGVYTPQVVRDGQDWSRWYQETPASVLAGSQRKAESARAQITLQRNRQGVYEADIQPQDARETWRAFWTVTEDDHTSKVKAGENRGEQLRHDYVVRQYDAVASQVGNARLAFKPIAAEASRPQRVNLVVTDAKTGKIWQALSLRCG
jgi:hypothetical protein